MRCAYPQAKQRKETALAREVADSKRPGESAPAAQLTGTPRGAGIADEKRARRSSEPL